MVFKNDYEKEFWIRAYFETDSELIETKATLADMAMEELRKREPTLLYDVYWIKNPTQIIGGLKSLRTVKGMSLKEAKDISDVGLPYKVASAVDERTANTMVAQMVSIGSFAKSEPINN